MTKKITDAKRLAADLWTPEGFRKIWEDPEEKARFEERFSRLKESVPQLPNYLNIAREAIQEFSFVKGLYATGAAALAKLAAPAEVEREIDEAYTSAVQAFYGYLARIVSAGPFIDTFMDDPRYREIYGRKVQEQRYISVPLAVASDALDWTDWKYKIGTFKVFGKELTYTDVAVAALISVATGTQRHFFTSLRGLGLVGAYTAAEAVFDKYFPSSTLFSAAAFGIATEKELERMWRAGELQR